jgi:hypothetical protein
MAITYRYVAGKIGDICQALTDDLKEQVPPLNAIIVNQIDKLPSHGVNSYLATFFGMAYRKVRQLNEQQSNASASAVM